MIRKSQLVFVPFPATGHLVSTIEFAKLLINHDEQLSITVLMIQAPLDHAVSSYTHSLTSSHSVPDRLHFILLPTHHDPHANSDQSTHPASFIESLIENQKPSVREAVSNLKSGSNGTRLAGFVVDMFCTSMIDVANEFGVPTMVFFIAGAAFLGFMLHIHAVRERDNVDTTAFNFKESGIEFAIPSFVNLVPASALTEAVLDKEWDSFFFNRANELRKVKCIMVNTFEELEPHAVQSFHKSDFKVYPVGPILSLGEDRDNKMVQQGSDVMEWLNDQPPSSVLFLCFGSRGYFEDNNQVTEIARALERSGVHFVWSLRKPPPKGSMNAPSDCSNLELEEVLPEGFLERTWEKGRVMGWVPQAQILGHKAVGGFVSHCGWNSILESIYEAVPIATWPLAAEQQLNAFLVVRELKLGVEISLDYRREVGGVVNAERIEKGIRQVMERESDVRKKVKEMSEISRRALMEGGSSHTYLERFIEGILE